MNSLGLLGEIIHFPASLAPEQLYLEMILIRVFAIHNYQFPFFPPVGLLWSLFKVSDLQGDVGQGHCATADSQKKASVMGCNCGLRAFCFTKEAKCLSRSKITVI